MNFRDRWETDEETGERFIFSIEMQRKLSEAGLPIEPASIRLLDDQPSAPRPRQDTHYEQKSEPVQDEPGQEVVGPDSIQIDPQTGKYIGQVKWYNTRKGYGFIMRGEGEEIFFHKSGSMGNPLNLQDGQWVLYDVEDTQKGPEAMDVEPYELPA